MKTKVQYTNRGFEIIEFADSNGKACSLQQSSAMRDYPDAYDKPGSSCVWLGQGDARMHLNREQVEELVTRLCNWESTGSFRNEEEMEDE